ncbi:hypothetical protein WB334_25535, partial [Escherichia coli]|uniref:hypothetical protein n=1 Tax=Escherichia coli TaxID=562 RepID=UPI002157EFBA
PGGPALRRAALRLAPLPCAPADALTCTSDLPEIAGHSSLVVTVSLSAAPTAADGSVSIQIGALEAHSTPITVDSPVTSLTVDPTDPLIAGSINTRTLTVGTATGIADPGTITFTSLDPDVTFGGSAGCDPPTGGSTLTCTGSSITLSISIA